MLFIEVSKKLASSRADALLTSVQTTESSGSTASTNAEWIRALKVRSVARRRPSTAVAAATSPTR